jgi:hypothetical protein
LANFGRQYRLTVGPLIITGLGITFKVKKTKKPTPNTCDIEVYNLTEAQRHELSSQSVVIPEGTDKAKVRGRIPCVLEAGYDTTEVLFAGNLRTAMHKKEGPTWITKLEGGDAGVSMGGARVSRSFPPGTKVATVVRACVEALQVGEGNLRAVENLLATRQGQVFEDGTTLFGKASAELKGLLASCGYTYSVQNGVLQVLKAGTPVRSDAVVLSASSGLLNAPTANPDGTLRVMALLTPGLLPGGTIDLRPLDESLRGQYEILRIEYSGNLAAKEWFAEMDVQR